MENPNEVLEHGYSEAIPTGGQQRKLEPFEEGMILEFHELDERTNKLGKYLQNRRHLAEDTWLVAHALERQYEAMKAYRSALYECCALRGLV